MNRNLSMYVQICILLILVVSADAGYARTWLIVPDGTGDAPTIQAGIDSAVAGDTVSLANGVFSGDGNRDLGFLGKAITVRSASGDPGTCTIDCGGQRGAVFSAGEGNNTVFEGIGITNGSDSYMDFGGGGIKVVGAAPTIRNCAIFGCSVLGGGAAIGCED